jgi:hypothetical protein
MMMQNIVGWQELAEAMWGLPDAGSGMTLDELLDEIGDVLDDR